MENRVLVYKELLNSILDDKILIEKPNHLLMVEKYEDLLEKLGDIPDNRIQKYEEILNKGLVNANPYIVDSYVILERIISKLKSKTNLLSQLMSKNDEIDIVLNGLDSKYIEIYNNALNNS